MRSLVTLLCACVLAQQFLFGQNALAASLAKIHQAYRSLRGNPNIEKLVMLDQELRRLLPPAGPFASANDLRPEYEEIGLTRGAFESGILVYSGKLLVDAHKIDPNSPYRSYTLYATVFPDGREDRTAVPSPAAARRYVEEFPDGPFGLEANLALAHFYDDLFKVIQRLVAGARNAKNYKYNCYSRYLSDRPLREQLSLAQQSALSFYRRALAHRPEARNVRESIANLERGSSPGWFFCFD